MQTAGMKHDLADKWGERLRILEAQLKREPANMMIWHWRGEARVLRFLLGRYGQQPSAPANAATFDAAIPPEPLPEPLPESSPEPLPALPTSALERSLLRLALLIPNVASKRLRPAPQERAAILERIRVARDEGRIIEDAEESWWEEVAAQIEASAYGGMEARRNALLLREREQAWKRRERERKEAERARR